MKLCTVCQTLKPLTEFYVNQKAHRCKPCHLEMVRKWYERNKESHNEKGRNRYASKRTEIKEKGKEYREQNRSKVMAHKALHTALRDGLVTPWPTCCMPDCDKKPEAHHPDYGQPLQVVWLCHGHHMSIHRASRQ